MQIGHGEFNQLTAILLLVVYTVFDFLYAVYYMFVAQKKAWSASITSVAMYLLSTFGIISFIENYWYIAYIIVGSFLGTFIAVKYFSEKIKYSS